MSREREVYTRRDTLRLRGFDYTSRRIYFITIVVSRRRRLFLDQRLARATIACLRDLRQKMGFAVYCYCLMPDHFHALIGTGESQKSLGQIVGAFKSSRRDDTGNGMRVNYGSASTSITSSEMIRIWKRRGNT